jgi:hypothetical protein
LSCGTFLVNSFLQLPGAFASNVILDGPVSPDRWALEDNAQWVERVSQDILRTCVAESSVCRGHLGEMAHLARYAMDHIIDGTLPCAERMPRLKEADAQYRISSWSTTFTQGEAHHPLLGPFWKRLKRCDDSDVEQGAKPKKANQANKPKASSMGQNVAVVNPLLASAAAAAAAALVEQHPEKKQKKKKSKLKISEG